MLMGMFERGNLPGLEAMLRFRSKRHLLLMNNVANAGNPHFRSRDVDVKAFQKMLRRALEDRSTGRTAGVELSSTGSFTARGGAFKLEPRVVFDGNMALDRNTVVLEREMARMMKNATHINVLTRLVNNQYRGLVEAWRGRIA